MPAEERTGEQEQHITYTTVKAPDFRSMYSNNVTFSAALFDFSMIFGEVVEAEQTSATTANLTVEQKVKIVMSPLHAKVFLDVAVRQLRNYELRFGEIKFPAGMSPQETSEQPPAKP